MRIREPRSTAIVFASGKMIITGPNIKNEKDYRKYIFSCDDHFNYRGIKFISEIIVKSFPDKAKKILPNYIKILYIFFIIQTTY